MRKTKNPKFPCCLSSHPMTTGREAETTLNVIQNKEHSSRALCPACLRNPSTVNCLVVAPCFLLFPSFILTFFLCLSYCHLFYTHSSYHFGFLVSPNITSIHPCPPPKKGESLASGKTSKNIISIFLEVKSTLFLLLKKKRTFSLDD